MTKPTRADTLTSKIRSTGDFIAQQKNIKPRFKKAVIEILSRADYELAICGDDRDCEFAESAIIVTQELIKEAKEVK